MQLHLLTLPLYCFSDNQDDMTDTPYERDCTLQQTLKRKYELSRESNGPPPPNIQRDTEAAIKERAVLIGKLQDLLTHRTEIPEEPIPEEASDRYTPSVWLPDSSENPRNWPKPKKNVGTKRKKSGATQQQITDTFKRLKSDPKTTS